MMLKTVSRLLLAGAFVCLLVSGPGLRAQASKSLDIRVKETAGIRRTTYPTGARIRFVSGALADAAHVRLLSKGTEVPAQVAAESTWPDGSVQWLWVDFNASLGPLEEAAYQLEYGGTVKAEAAPRGLTVTEDADGIQIGNVQLGLTGAPLLRSAKYRQEHIGQGPNGFAIVDTAGASHDAAGAEDTKVEIVKRGPLLALVRYTGRWRLTSTYAVGYITTVEMPNSKSWVKMTTTLADPEKRVRELSFHTPLTLGAQPWSWDFGTGSWTYGLLRNRTDVVTLSQVVSSSQATRWEIKTGPKGQEQIVETAGGRRPNLAEGWGHIQDQREVVAFAVPDFGAEAGTHAIALDGEGQTSFRWTPARPLGHMELAVYEHFVSTPVAVGAATSPASMLHPLVVSVSSPR